MKPVSPVATKLQIAGTGIDPASFEEVVLAESQPEYLPLPVLRLRNDQFGVVTCRWSLTWRERLRILFNGNFWISQLTFNQPFTPIRPATTFAELFEEDE